MARFNYRLQGVLNLRLQQEEQVKMEFAQASKELNDQIDILNDYIATRDAFIREGYELRSASIMDVQKIMDNNYYQRQMDVIIKDQEVKVDSYAAKLEVARLKLTRAVQERKMQERLKEKAFEQFVEEEKEAEAKEVDERSSFTYTQRSREEE
ncbi:flagellar export protein FliJ [Butyrivibrio sp. AE3004]|uniref:flagellar export protein FliJ n=1 Tax=Butyrivibrio sp. AE3004 TaxID=1506994 RepID=UPI000493FB1E|nr:flagellar export protein FliJ [Butyrivibrio sp. AE3004]